MREITEAIEATTEALWQRLIDNILERTEVLRTQSYGPHTITTYKDGRKSLHVAKRWEHEPLYGPTPYELLQLGEEMPRLYPLPLWARLGLGFGALASAALWAPLLFTRKKENP